MKKIIIAFMFSLIFFSCKKEEPNCVTWLVLYYQGDANHVTKTNNYFPYNGDLQICGAGKDTVQRGKQSVIRQVSANLFDYMSFEAKK